MRQLRWLIVSLYLIRKLRKQIRRRNEKDISLSILQTFGSVTTTRKKYHRIYTLTFHSSDYFVDCAPAISDNGFAEILF
jgi:hypothetical protein